MASVLESATTYYEVLGVDPHATTAEIKRARLRRVREFPPEQCPEEFMDVERAHKILADPKARQEYDILLVHGPALEQLRSEGDAFFAQESYAEAAIRFQRIVELHPTDRAASNLLGICHTRLKNWIAAKDAYAQLLRHAAEVPLYQRNYAFVFVAEADAATEPSKEQRLAQDARIILAQARRLAPEDASADLMIARSYFAERAYDKALGTLETAIASGKATLDVDDYVFWARAWIAAGRDEEVDVLAERMSAQLGQGTDRQRVASGLAEFSLAVHERHNFVLARGAISIASKLVPSDASIVQLHDEWNAAQAASDEYDRLAEDNVVIPPLRFLMAVYSDRVRNLEVDTPMIEILSKVESAIWTYDRHEIVAAAKAIRDRYPALYRVDRQVIDGLIAGQGFYPSVN